MNDAPDPVPPDENQDRLPPFWALGDFVAQCHRFIYVLMKYGSKRKSRSDVLPPFTFGDVGDLLAFSNHFKSTMDICLTETKSIQGLFAEYPALMARDAGPDSRRQVEEATKRFQHIYITAGLLYDSADTCYRASRSVKEQLLGPFVNGICMHANNALRKLTQKYRTQIPDWIRQLDAAHKLALKGEISNVSLKVDVELDLSELQDTIERLGVCLDALTAETEEKRAEQERLAAAHPPPFPGAGLVYAMINPSMPGLVKIGKTRRSGDERALELSSTGVPTAFIVIYEKAVDDCDAAERHAHRLLAEHRVSDNREFFQIKPKHAIDILMSLGADERPIIPAP